MHILLVTSRGTRRWVIPKGNLPVRTAPHVAASREAEEEAGVRGLICSTAIGSYHYRKRRANGASLMVDVDVFPLAVTEERANWKEQSQRERRWFTVAEAADAVEETDLRDLIRSFDAAEFDAATRRIDVFDSAAPHPRIGRTFGWVRRLLTKVGKLPD